MTGPTPLLDFFRRGEVARDVRLLAAQGGLAPRAREQLGILVHLLDDPDPEISRTADATLSKIPPQALGAFLARADAPVALREFFAARGIGVAAEAAAEAAGAPGAALDEDAPLVDTADADGLDDEEADRASVVQRLATMTFPERLKAAVKGSRELRSILIRDPNKMIASAVLSSPKLTEQEVENIARMTNVSDDVLRTIGQNRAWTKNYQIVMGLTKNPKTPLAMSLNFMMRLNDRDLGKLAVDRNVPEALRIAARKKLLAATTGG